MTAAPALPRGPGQHQRAAWPQGALHEALTLAPSSYASTSVQTMLHEKSMLYKVGRTGSAPLPPLRGSGSLRPRAGPWSGTAGLPPSALASLGLTPAGSTPEDDPFEGEPILSGLHGYSSGLSEAGLFHLPVLCSAWLLSLLWSSWKWLFVSLSSCHRPAPLSQAAWQWLRAPSHQACSAVMTAKPLLRLTESGIIICCHNGRARGRVGGDGVGSTDSSYSTLSSRTS